MIDFKFPGEYERLIKLGCAGENQKMSLPSSRGFV